MNQFNHSAYEQEIGSVEEEPRQRLSLETIGKAGLMWADPTLSKEKVAAATEVSTRELRRLFGKKPRSVVSAV